MKKLKKYISPLAAAGYILFIVGSAVLVCSRYSPTFADFYNETIGAFFRWLLMCLTYLYPASFAEFLLLCLPVMIFLLFRYAVCHAAYSWHDTARYIVSIVSVAAAVLGCMNINFTPGYYCTPIESRLGLDMTEVTKERLAETADILLGHITDLSEEIRYGDDGFSYFPDTTDGLSRKLNSAYEGVCEKYGFIQNMTCRVKPIALSEPMTYTHIAGVYTFFTGESNLNINFPDYTLPFTAAHEMAHQRGVAREDEANFVAFLVCINSDDEYIRYSGYLNIYEYVASALYQTDRELYYDVLAKMNDEIRGELIAYSEFFEKYEKNIAADISGTVNDTYLKQNGQQAGTRSYELVVRLAVAYLCSE